MSQNFLRKSKGDTVVCPYDTTYVLSKAYLGKQLKICQDCITKNKKVSILWSQHERQLKVVDSLYQKRIANCENAKKAIESECLTAIQFSIQTNDSISRKLQRSIVYLGTVKKEHQDQIDSLNSKHKKKTLWIGIGSGLGGVLVAILVRAIIIR